mmetsp:Transcript_28638/g.59987  ORF Transcript_28638/g.59987 Transcript_28638/m.59987 type:complete len:102 (+) Transcript_28638:76-381(+)
MRGVRTFSRRCNLGGSKRTKVDNNLRGCSRPSTTNFGATGGTTKSTTSSFGRTSSGQYRAMGSCVPSFSVGNLSCLTLAQPSAVTASTSLLEYDNEDIDGT